jgi:hypothetical protein
MTPDVAALECIRKRVADAGFLRLGWAEFYAQDIPWLLQALAERDMRIRELAAKAERVSDHAVRLLMGKCDDRHGGITWTDFIVQGGAMCSLCLHGRAETAEAQLADARRECQRCNGLMRPVEWQCPDCGPEP